MSKRKILFVCSSMNVGGAEKSLVNLLNMIDYQKYDVSLLLLKNQGPLKTQIPVFVKLISLPPRAKALFDISCFSFTNVILKIIKYFSTGLETILWHHYDVVRAYRWKHFYGKICEKFYDHFDVAIAFQSGECTYFAFDKIYAKRYVTYFHTDIKNIKIAKEIDVNYLNKANLILTISPQCVNSIVSLFPSFKEKTKCLENPSSSDLVKKLAGEVLPDEYLISNNCLRIVSVGRLIDIKGYDLVVDAAMILREKGFSFNWFIVGEGQERKNLEKRIKLNRVEDCVHLIGLKLNPYPYIKFADLLVQSSRYEGKSVVLDEAKILGKQILVTNYNSAKDQIIDGVNGYICDINAKSIAEGIIKIIRHPITVQDNVKRDNVSEYMNILLGDDEK